MANPTPDSYIVPVGDAVIFTDTTHEGREGFYGQSRGYTSFTALATENAYSRVPLGVHVQADSDKGVRLSYEIADAVSDFDLSN